MTVKYDWSKGEIARYQDALNARLANADIPQCVIGCSYACNNIDHNSAIDRYYADIVSCIRQYTDDCVPQIRNRINCYNVPGWSDVVKDKHDAARSAFLIGSLWASLELDMFTSLCIAQVWSSS